MNPSLEEGMLYTVDLWWSHPRAGNDDCCTGCEAPTLEEAERLLASVEEWAHPSALRNTAWIIVMDADGNIVREKRNPSFKKPSPRRAAEEDEEWRREIATQAGMAFGVEAYNEEMGYGLDDSEGR